jgi:hypothetical protein
VIEEALFFNLAVLPFLLNFFVLWSIAADVWNFEFFGRTSCPYPLFPPKVWISAHGEPVEGHMTLGQWTYRQATDLSWWTVVARFELRWNCFVKKLNFVLGTTPSHLEGILPRKISWNLKSITRDELAQVYIVVTQTI